MQEYTNESLNEFLDNSIKKIDLDFINKLKSFEGNINNLNELSKSLIFLYLSDALSLDNIVGHNQDLPNALTYANEAEVYMKGLPDEDDLKKRLYFIKGHIHARMGEAEKSKESFVKYIYLNEKNKSRINFIEIVADAMQIIAFSSMSYYSFRAINKYVITDLINDEITLTDPALFNDPFDTLMFNFLELARKKTEEKSKYDIKPLCDAYKYIKVRCFVKDNFSKHDKAFQNLLMWSHYADSHKGICIRYKFNHKEVEEYREKYKFSNWFDVDYKQKIDLKGSESPKLKLLFATKNECWNYENEVRLIHFDPECENEFKQIPLKEIDSKVEAIFFGCKCPNKDKETIKEIFKGKDVAFFEFKKIPKVIWSDIYKLEPEDEERFDKLKSELSYEVKL